MSGLFNFSPEELLTFFAILVRFSVLSAVLPIIGDRMVPAPVKILFALSVSLCLYPALVRSGFVKPGEALIWGATTGGIVMTIALEALVGLTLGYVARFCFDTISFGANLSGTFMGLAMASHFDPHQESQTQVLAEVQMAVAMLLFLVLDGHHLVFRAALQSYEIVGFGKAAFGQVFEQKIIEFTGQVVLFGLEISAPVSISMFVVNVAFGVIAKAIPQLNVLVLSMSVTALIGLMVLFISMPQFGSVAASLFERTGDQMVATLNALVGKG